MNSVYKLVHQSRVVTFLLMGLKGFDKNRTKAKCGGKAFEDHLEKTFFLLGHVRPLERLLASDCLSSISSPSRFISSSGTVSKPDYFIPFGTGKRTCLGDGIVKATLFLGISTLLQNFDISLPPGFPLPDMDDIPGLVVPRHNVQLVFSRQQKCASTTIDMA